MAEKSEVRLTDLVREVSGWPIDLDRVARMLSAADKELPGGRDCTRALTAAEVAAVIRSYECRDDG